MPMFQLGEMVVSKLDSIVSEVETWLNQKIAAQEKLELWEEPVLLPSELEKKGQLIQDAIRRAVRDASKPKPKQKSTTASSTSTNTSSEATVMSEAETAVTETALPDAMDDPVSIEAEEITSTTTTTITSTIIVDEPEPTSVEVKHEEL
jgi:hypothetical protein